MEFFADYAGFFARTVTIVAAIGIVMIMALVIRKNRREGSPGHLEVQKLNDFYKDLREQIQLYVLEKDALKSLHKEEKKSKKEKEKSQKKKKKDTSETESIQERKGRVYVLDFDGDIEASATDHLRHEVTAVLNMADTQDEVVLRLESGGGVVHGYGLAASQLARIRQAGVPLTICVDKVAASGGYMMACIANRILSAPFAILGSIGVVAQMPNLHRLLKKHDIDFEVLTAGEYKRTLTVFGENTEKGREKFQRDLELTHTLFKSFVAHYRPQLDIDEIATGEIWLGQSALDNQLVDELKTSDEYLSEKAKVCDVFQLRFVQRKTLQERVGIAAAMSMENTFLKIWERLNQRFWH